MLTNCEVLDILLQESTTAKNQTSETKESQARVLKSLLEHYQKDKDSSIESAIEAARADRATIEGKVQELKSRYQLTREEVLQLLNHSPKGVLEAFLCVENAILEGRIQEEDLENIVKIL